MTTPLLPPKPLPPEGYDCCGGGCADCELRLYIERLKEWQRKAAALTPERGALPPPAQAGCTAQRS